MSTIVFLCEFLLQEKFSVVKFASTFSCYLCLLILVGIVSEVPQ